MASFLHVGLYTDNWRRSPTEIYRDETTGGGGGGGWVHLGMAAWAEAVGESLGGDEGIAELSEAQMRGHVVGDENMKEHLTECWRYMEEFGYDGGDPETIYPCDINAEGLLTPVKEYMESEDWSQLLG
ncbi:hypothetical protein B0T22DRAFT_480582 [Podospora appendiculata]|uniref:Uncharacterized protein n=1 Tax=Podospora appendiculata TaxID=314037 RepID=A0AAE0XBV5_9PEZI|nr:hypothetical protein B0T22DRAFT_480582 [Podospora appendiculata]